MLFHASIDAEDPARVASVLAVILGGTVMPFPPVPGSFIVIANDEHGTAIEVYPAGHVLIPGDREAEAIEAFDSPRATATHLALGVSCGVAELERLAAQEWWLCRTCSRGGAFHVVEFWIENRIMLELLTPEMQAEYRDVANPERLRAHFASMKAARRRRERAPARERLEVAHG